MREVVALWLVLRSITHHAVFESRQYQIFFEQCPHNDWLLESSPSLLISYRHRPNSQLQIQEAHCFCIALAQARSSHSMISLL